MSLDVTATSGPLCILLDTPTTGVCELETRSSLYPRLDTVSRVCQSTLEPDRQSSVTCQGPEGTAGSSSTSLEVSDMVSDLVGDANSEAPPITKQARSDTTDSQSHTSRMGYLRDRFQSEKISEGASKLLLASWRQKMQSRMIPFLINGLAGVVKGISGGINEVVNF